jgi:patatin-related protein
MKEKELRLALVYYGGVSLAIYQHGVNLEILNLLRASKAYHGPRNSARKQAADHVYQSAPGAGDISSTEDVYFDLLKLIGKSIDLRIVVDVISGSSAGGINGIVLARAIAHDLTIAPLTDMWFTKADVLQLIATEARASRWSKWYLTPLLWPIFARLEREGVLPRNSDAGIRQRLSTFFRSRWFKPPFDGPHFSSLLLDGLTAMEGSGVQDATLLPPEIRLDLMITVTDYHGAEQLIFMHDPAVIREREHRQILRFNAVRSSHRSGKWTISSPNEISSGRAGSSSLQATSPITSNSACDPKRSSCWMAASSITSPC